MLSEKLRSFSMQDLTLIRDEDTLPLHGPDGRLRPGPSSLLDTIEDLGTGWAGGREGKEVTRWERHPDPCSPFLPTTRR